MSINYISLTYLSIQNHDWLRNLSRQTVVSLLNNLGIYEAVGFFDETDEAWRRLFEVNILSGVRLARHYLETMLAKKTGRVIFMASEAAVSPTSLIERLIDPKEVADFVAYVSSPLASAINGAALRVDGGLVGSVF